MTVKIHPEGFILGGSCHRGLNDRARRNVGSDNALSDALKQKCLVFKNGRGRVVKRVRRPKLRHFGGGHSEIGYLRACQVVFEPLMELGKSFRMSQLETWLTKAVRLEPGGEEPNEFHDYLYGKGYADTFEDEAVKSTREGCH